MRSLLVLFVLALSCSHAPAAQPAGEEVLDPQRPVPRVTRESFTIQYATPTPQPTRVQIRAGTHTTAVRQGLMGNQTDPWTAAERTSVRTVEVPGARVFHRVTIEGLQPGQRYFYRVWSPDDEPTADERNWGAAEGWRAEKAAATLPPHGKHAAVRLPVIAVVMPNVVSTYGLPADAQQPPRASAEDLEEIREEFRRASRFYWVNSGMRLWVDFDVRFDERWLRWGQDNQNLPDFAQSLPASRSWAGTEYRSPGGGGFHTIDPDDITATPETAPPSDQPYPMQVELAMPWRWYNGKWERRGSGGGTLGVGNIHRGVRGQSQYLGGGDIAWLTTHEVHHQLESISEFALAFREDDRIVYNHYMPRNRTRSPNAASTREGAPNPWPWATGDRHGQHYDGMAFWLRTMSPAQFLRINLGEIVLLPDQDNDGFPDSGNAPLTERAFGSSPNTPTTDGRTQDAAKAMLSTWAPFPNASTWQRAQQQYTRPDPRNPDSDGDGIDDVEDPEPLLPAPPFVWHRPILVDGETDDWNGLPHLFQAQTDTYTATYTHAYDQRAYYGRIVLTGDAVEATVTLDAEGKGVFNEEGIAGFRVTRTPAGLELRNAFSGAPGLSAKLRTRDVNGTTQAVAEFQIENWAEDGWYWRGAGREVGVVVELRLADGSRVALHDPYHLVYTRMIEAPGNPPPPPGAPSELSEQDADLVLAGDDPRIQTNNDNWQVREGELRHTGGAESAAYIEVPPTGDFDLHATLRGRSDLILGAFTSDRMTATQDYIAFVGGYGNTRTKMRLFGSEAGETGRVVSEPRHTVQFSRRDGDLWLLIDGRAVLWNPDPRPDTAVTRIGVLGGYAGQQVIEQLRLRTSHIETD